MRVVLLLVLSVALVAPSALAQDEELRVHETPLFEVLLPSTFLPDTSVVAEDSWETRINFFIDTASDRMLVITTHTGWSWWQRFKFNRGWGASKQTPHTYTRITPASLRLAEPLASSAGSAFYLESPTSDIAGLEIRGCEDTVCYSISVGDGSAGSDVTAQEFASELSGIQAQR